MPPKGWKSITIPDNLYEYSMGIYLTEDKNFKKENKNVSYGNWVAEKLWSVLTNDLEEEKANQPKIEDSLLEDMNDLFSLHHTELRRQFKIRNHKEFVEDAIKVYLNLCYTVIQRNAEKKT